MKLISFELGNFLSFNTPVKFSLVAGKAKQHRERLSKNNETGGQIIQITIRSTDIHRPVNSSAIAAGRDCRRVAEGIGIVRRQIRYYHERSAEITIQLVRFEY